MRCAIQTVENSNITEHMAELSGNTLSDKRLEKRLMLWQSCIKAAVISSQCFMKNKISGLIHVEAKISPVVELDSEAHAAYVRVSRNKVVRTELVDDRSCIVTIDRDRRGDAVGIEFVGVDQFGIRALLRKGKITLPKKAIDRASYVPADLQPA